jgi:hypothetical protein
MMKNTLAASCVFGILQLILVAGKLAQAQTPQTVPTVLGCTNPAPAAAGKPTVFFPSCTTAAFLPTSTSSVVGSVSKTLPVWAHSFSGYAASALLVACPAGAIVSGAKCTVNGADASALVAQSQVAAFKVPTTPVTPTCPAQPDQFLNLTWTCSYASGKYTCTAPTQ